MSARRPEGSPSDWGSDSEPTWTSGPFTGGPEPSGPIDSDDDDAYFAALRSGLHGGDPAQPAPPSAAGSPAGWPDLGDYRVLGRIGRGGFGQVLRAFDPVLGREVALKVPRPDALPTPELRERFRREAQTAARLDHPNVVSVYDYRVQGELCFIVTALVDGPNLQAWLRQRADRPVPPALAARLLATLADAVQHAHDRGILHADIKPSNVVLKLPPAGPAPDGPGSGSGSGSGSGPGSGPGGEADPVPRLTDFGLARALSPEGDASRGGMLHGTPPYMAPEQVLGRRDALSVRTDVYALGATLYQVLTGRPPFAGESRGEILWQVTHADPVAPRALRPGLPRDLETITLQCLEKDPRRRYATAADLAADLRRHLDGRPIAARPPAPHEQLRAWARRRPRVAAALGLALLGLLTAGTVLAVRNHTLQAAQKALQQKQRELEEQARVARQEAARARALAAQNARHLRNARLRQVREDLDAGAFERAQQHLMEVARFGAESLGEEPGFAWRWLDRRARVPFDLLAGHERPIFDQAFSPDGRRAVTVERHGGDRIWDLAAPWPTSKPLLPGRSVFLPSFSADGRLIAAWECTDAAGDLQLKGFLVLDGATGAELGRIAPPVEPGPPPAHGGFSTTWLGPRTLGIGWRESARFPLAAYDVSDPARPVELHRDTGLTYPLCPGQPGTGLYGATRGSTVGIYEAATGRPVREWSGLARRTMTAAMEREARALLVELVEPPGGFVVLGRSDGREIGRVATPEGWKGYPILIDGGGLVAWVDTLGRVALADVRSGRTQVLPIDDSGIAWDVRLAIDPEGTLLLAKATHPGGGAGPVARWELPSGRRLAPPVRPGSYSTPMIAPGGRLVYSATDRWLYRWHLDATDPDPDAAHQPDGHADEAWSLAFRPDGRRLASGADDTDEPHTIKVWDVDTGRLVRGWSAGLGTVTALAYAPDGKALASVHLTPAANVRLWDPETGELTATLHGHTAPVRAVAYSPDGTLLATAGDDRTIRLWDAATHAPVATLRDPTNKVRGVAFGPRGRLFAAAGNDDTVRLWDLRDPAAPRPRHAWAASGHVAAVAFAADGGAVLAVDEAGTILAWEVESGAPRLPISGSDALLRNLSPSPDGSTLAVGDQSGRVVLWDLPTGEVLLKLDGHEAQVNCVRFSPDGDVLASCDHRGRVRLWRGRLPTDPPLALRLPPRPAATAPAAPPAPAHRD